MDCGEEFYELETPNAELPQANRRLGAQPREIFTPKNFGGGKTSSPGSFQSGKMSEVGMSTAAPSLKLLAQQNRRDPNNRYFHVLAVSPDECGMIYCVDCGVGMAEVIVSSDEPMRQKEPMCKAHAFVAHAEWMANL